MLAAPAAGDADGQEGHRQVEHPSGGEAHAGGSVEPLAVPGPPRLALGVLHHCPDGHPPSSSV
jgi:hypothetical protein